MKIARLTVTALVVLVLQPGLAAAAGFKTVSFRQPVETASVANLFPDFGVLVIGRFKPRAAGQTAIVNTVAFKAQTTGLTVNASWVIQTSTSPIRLIGVNIDLVDQTGALVASDAFAGVLAGSALSTLTFDGLTQGATYRLIFKGTQVTGGSYTMAIETR